MSTAVARLCRTGTSRAVDIPRLWEPVRHGIELVGSRIERGDADRVG